MKDKEEEAGCLTNYKQAAKNGWAVCAPEGAPLFSLYRIVYVLQDELQTNQRLDDVCESMWTKNDKAFLSVIRYQWIQIRNYSRSSKTYIILICVSDILNDNLEAIISAHKNFTYFRLDLTSLILISFLWTAMCKIMHQTSHLGSVALQTVKKDMTTCFYFEKKRGLNETHMLNFPSYSRSTHTKARRKGVMPRIMLNSL